MNEFEIENKHVIALRSINDSIGIYFKGGLYIELSPTESEEQLIEFTKKSTIYTGYSVNKEYLIK